MNWLAHLYLARDEPDHRVGNLMGDFLQGVGVPGVPERFREGVLMHLEVDRFTDSHPVMLRAQRRLVVQDPTLQRVAGVLLDVWFDHLLARSWSEHHPDQSLEEFTGDCYRDGLARLEVIPGRLPQVLPHMAEGDWLSSYTQVEQIRQALRGMAARRRRPLPLEQGLETLMDLDKILAADFAEFMPALRQRFAPHRIR